jgi:periplasmic protein TonB
MRSASNESWVVEAGAPGHAMASQRAIKRRERFVIACSFGVSLAMHAAVIIALTLHRSPAPQPPAPLVVFELQGIVDERQIEQKPPPEETQGQQDAQAPEPAPAAAPQAASSDERPTIDTVAGEAAILPLPPPPKPAAPPRAETQQPPNQQSTPATGPRTIPTHDAPQNARTIKTEKELIELYVRLLAKKIETNLVYPDEARGARLQGTATVSFTILASGDIRSDSLAIIASSGQSKLDESALRTVRASVPFDPPPKEITVSVGVTFGPEDGAHRE